MGKKKIFLLSNSLQRIENINEYKFTSNYFHVKLPKTKYKDHLFISFKKLFILSKHHLCDDLKDPVICYCPDCLAPLNIPLDINLNKVFDITNINLSPAKHDNTIILREKRLEHEKTMNDLRDIINHNIKELKTYWNGLDNEAKWRLTEIPTTQLATSICNSSNWEPLRAALDSYSKYAWEDDVLEINDDIVSLTDDICAERGMNEMLDAMIDAVNMIFDSDQSLFFHAAGVSTNPKKFSDEEWDRIGRRRLETLVLSEFAFNICTQYLMKMEESREQQVALELELELLQEQELMMKNKIGGKKKKKKKKKK